MNNKGQIMMISVMVGIMIFIAGMLMVNFLKPEVTRLRSSDNLDCANASAITDGTKVACLVTDLVVIYWIFIILSFAGGVVTDRFLT